MSIAHTCTNVVVIGFHEAEGRLVDVKTCIWISKFFYFSTRESFVLAKYPVSGEAKRPTRHVAHHLSYLNIMLKLDLLEKLSGFISLVLDPRQAGLNLSHEKSLLSKNVYYRASHHHGSFGRCYSTRQAKVALKFQPCASKRSSQAFQVMLG